MARSSMRPYGPKLLWAHAIIHNILGSPRGEPLSESQTTVRRERTAIRRYRCSRPVSLALANGLIAKGMSVLDYGCGHGADVRYLKSKKIRARGWDPHYAPDRRGLQPADVVNLGYVLNDHRESQMRGRRPSARPLDSPRRRWWSQYEWTGLLPAPMRRSSATAY